MKRLRLLLPLFAPGLSAVVAAVDGAALDIDEHGSISFIDSFSGYSELNQYVRVHSLDRFKRDEVATGKPLEDVYEVRSRTRLKADMTFSSVVSGELSIDAEFYDNLNQGDWHSENNIRLWEAYLDFDFTAVSVRLGRQVIRWGKADEINIIDNFTPQDVRNGLDYKRGDRKWPVLALTSKYFFAENYTLENIWLPYFRPNPIAGRQQDWELFIGRNYVNGIGLTPIGEDRSKNSLDNGVYATKLAYAADGYDLSLSYAYHFEQFPAYNVNLNLTAEAMSESAPLGTVQREHKREQTLGMDYETQLGGFGLRGELAYTTDKPYATFDLNNSDLIVRKPTLQLVAGFDYRFESQTYINLQLTMDHIRDFDTLMAAERNEYSLTWQISRPFAHDQLEVEFMGRAFLHETDLFCRFNVMYELTDAIQINSGLMLFEGNDLGIFGEFDYNDQVYFNLKYSF